VSNAAGHREFVDAVAKSIPDQRLERRFLVFLADAGANTT
jgi:hypothetical protein